MARNMGEKEEKKKRAVKSQKVEKSKTTKLNKEEKKIKNTKTKKIESKSVQNKVIENIKSFISKIIEMQEKVRKEEEEEKNRQKKEKDEIKQGKIDLNEPKHLLEYYDLPFRYNETVVKILAQTPKRLFVYWDVADKDRQTYLNAFGENFFQDTYPVLLVHNENKNYTTEVAINDFANSWYLDISNPRDQYTIQLGRKFKSHIKPQINPEIAQTNVAINNDYLFIAISNKLEVPNDHILFEEFKPYVTYRNVKTMEEEVKDIKNSLYKNELKELYQELYHGEIDGEKFDMLNPSSMGTSSSIAK